MSVFSYVEASESCFAPLGDCSLARPWSFSPLDGSDCACVSRFVKLYAGAKYNAGGVSAPSQPRRMICRQISEMRMPLSAKENVLFCGKAMPAS